MVHEIDTIPNCKPVSVPPYRLSPAKRDSLLKQVHEMLKEGIIVPSKSEWSSSPVMVPKTDGSWRMAIDYRT